MVAALASSFGLIGLLLASTGLYAVSDDDRHVDVGVFAALTAGDRAEEPEVDDGRAEMTAKLRGELLERSAAQRRDTHVAFVHSGDASTRRHD